MKVLKKRDFSNFKEGDIYIFKKVQYIKRDGKEISSTLTWAGIIRDKASYIDGKSDNFWIITPDIYGSYKVGDKFVWGVFPDNITEEGFIDFYFCKPNKEEERVIRNKIIMFEIENTNNMDRI